MKCDNCGSRGAAAPEPATDNTLAEQVERACREPTLIDALAYIALWECERAIKQAMRGERDADGKGWDTMFKVCFEAVHKRWLELDTDPRD